MPVDPLLGHSQTVGHVFRFEISVLGCSTLSGPRGRDVVREPDTRERLESGELAHEVGQLIVGDHLNNPPEPFSPLGRKVAERVEVHRAAPTVAKSDMATKEPESPFRSLARGRPAFSSL